MDWYARMKMQIMMMIQPTTIQIMTVRPSYFRSIQMIEEPDTMVNGVPNAVILDEW